MVLFFFFRGWVWNAGSLLPMTSRFHERSSSRLDACRACAPILLCSQEPVLDLNTHPFRTNSKLFFCNLRGAMVAQNLQMIQDSFYGVLWTLQKNRKQDLVRYNTYACLLNLFLDFCHLFAFLVHSKPAWFHRVGCRVTRSTRSRWLRLRQHLAHAGQIRPVCPVAAATDEIQ